MNGSPACVFLIFQILYTPFHNHFQAKEFITGWFQLSVLSYTGHVLVQQIQEVVMLPINIAGYTVLLYATKYIFFFFAAARYLYLILLEIVTPIAIILYLDEKTRHYTHAYLKNLFVCYMTIPAFLIANAMGGIISENVMHMCGQNKYTMLGLLFAFVFKLFLFAKSVKYCRELF